MDIEDLDTVHLRTPSALSLEDKQKLLDIRWGRRDCDFIQLNTQKTCKLRFVAQSHNCLTFIYNQDANAELKVYIFYISEINNSQLYKRYKVALTIF